MSVLVRNPEDWFSCVRANFVGSSDNSHVWDASLESMPFYASSPIRLKI